MSHDAGWNLNAAQSTVLDYRNPYLIASGNRKKTLPAVSNMRESPTALARSAWGNPPAGLALLPVAIVATSMTEVLPIPGASVLVEADSANALGPSTGCIGDREMRRARPDLVTTWVHIFAVLVQNGLR